MSGSEYRGAKTRVISFPLGGIGAGCIGLAGDGRLIDWEIFNRPSKGSLNGMSHFAVKAERDGEVLDTRILHGDLAGPYIGDNTAAGHASFGWGPSRENLCGMPHFREHVFRGEFPLAQIAFHDDAFPGEVTLHAWSPFIPANDVDSGLPGAFFEVEIENTADSTLDYTVVGALSNPFGQENALNRVVSDGDLHQLTVTNTALALDDPAYGEITLSAEAEDVSYQSYWFRGAWCDDLEVYWHDLMQPGRFTDRVYETGRQDGWTKRDTGHLAVHFSLGAGERRRVRFAVTWHVPNCTNYWRADAATRAAEAGLENAWKNWYVSQWADSRASGRYAMAAWSRLREETGRFHNVLFTSSLPDAATEAISANLSTLTSPTCLRLEDGTFYGWEGTGCTGGCCEGSCTHVWNYAQALPFLFPALERSMRSVNYAYNVDDAGGSHFRLQLPLGIRAKTDDYRPCADGQFGDVIKTYRDWKVSGDTDWLRSLWPTIRRTLEYAWSDRNPDRWDPDRTGVLWGRQHHTLDMELFGPNAWLTGYYLAALKAASEMAPVCGDAAFGELCRDLFEKGKAWADAELFNGSYYAQLIDLENRDLVAQFDEVACGCSDCDCRPADAVDRYWSDETGEIKYQIGQGIDIDMTIAQWHADLYGLGEIYAPAQVKVARAITFAHNFKTSMRDVVNPWRNYVLNDEAGLQICTYPEGVRRPVIPLPYGEEDQNGYSYAAAIGMIQSGLVDEGMAVIEAIRSRYDGEKRNPWNEIECGSNYARSMASYSLLNVFSGFGFDQTRGMIGFDPIVSGDCRFLWSLDGAWGEVEFVDGEVILRVLYGALTLAELGVPHPMGEGLTAMALDGEIVDFTVADGCVHTEWPVTIQVGQSLVLSTTYNL